MHLGVANLFSGSTGTWLTTLVVALLSGLIPLINIEAYPLAVAALTPAAPWPVILMTTLGQMMAKTILHQAGHHGIRPRTNRLRKRLDRAESAMRRNARGPDAVVLTSALTGFPPFFGVSVMAGVLAIPLGRFLLVATPPRLARFTIVFFAPRLVQNLF